jgi:hypothetical protein
MGKPKARNGQNLACVDRQAAALRHHAKSAAIWDDINNFWKLEEMKVHELAVKHGKTEKWIRQNLVRSTKYGQQR